MIDRAGTEITVGCRVAEADFSFGDGTVMSIKVPCNGGGFCVGVHWATQGWCHHRYIGRGV